jgi:uroporphyrinogen-III decarboxylase
MYRSSYQYFNWRNYLLFIGVDLMENSINFKCQGDNLEEIPAQVSEKIGVTFPEAHTSSKYMALLSKEFKDFTNNSVCIVPFCSTVEAEALGGKIKLGNEKAGPRVESYIFNSIEELAYAKKIDFTNKRIKEVLNCVEDLSNQGEVVCLNVEGPFTIISSLIDPMILYKGIRKNKDIIDNFLVVIEDSIVEYVLEGVKMGAKIISYGDPVGAMDIVGPKVYEHVSAKTTYSILKRLDKELKGKAVMHLCGKTSTAFEKLGLCESIKIEYNDEITYGQAICRVIEDMKDVSIVGHSCIKRTRLMMKKPVVWNIKLK